MLLMKIKTFFVLFPCFTLHLTLYLSFEYNIHIKAHSRFIKMPLTFPHNTDREICFENNKCLHIRQFSVYTQTPFTSTHWLNMFCFVFFLYILFSTLHRPLFCHIHVCLLCLDRAFVLFTFLWVQFLIKFCWWQQFLQENDFFPSICEFATHSSSWSNRNGNCHFEYWCRPNTTKEVEEEKRKMKNTLIERIKQPPAWIWLNGQVYD